MRRRPEGRSGAAVARYSISILAAPSTSEQSPLCSDVLLFLRAKRTSSARFLALPLQIEPSALGFDLWPPCGRRFSFNIKTSLLTVPSKRKERHLLKAGVFPPFGFSSIRHLPLNFFHTLSTHKSICQIKRIQRHSQDWLCRWILFCPIS